MVTVKTGKSVLLFTSLFVQPPPHSAALTVISGRVTLGTVLPTLLQRQEQTVLHPQDMAWFLNVRH